jgi:hypothetical protein
MSANKDSDARAREQEFREEEARRVAIYQIAADELIERTNIFIQTTPTTASDICRDIHVARTTFDCFLSKRTMGNKKSKAFQPLLDYMNALPSTYQATQSTPNPNKRAGTVNTASESGRGAQGKSVSAPAPSTPSTASTASFRTDSSGSGTRTGAWTRAEVGVGAGTFSVSTPTSASTFHTEPLSVSSYTVDLELRNYFSPPYPAAADSRQIPWTPASPQPSNALFAAAEEKDK